MSLPRLLAFLALAFLADLTPGHVKAAPTPPAAPDEVVFRPTGKDYPRQPQIIQGKRSPPEFDHVSLSPATVADVAQIYADFSKKEVRVPRSLLERKLSMGGGMQRKVAFGYVLSSFASELAHDGVNVAPLGADVVAFRAGKSFQEQMEAMQSPPATPEQIAAAKAALSEDRFWQLIEAASRGGKTDHHMVGMILQTALGRLRPEEIFGFQLRLHERLNECYRWDLWAVAYIVNGGASDDGFEYFRAWLISQGRAYFEAALKNPVRAADRATNDQQNECESLLYAAMEAYQARTNKLPPVPPVTGTRSGPAGQSWREEDLPRLYPDLVKKFR